MDINYFLSSKKKLQSILSYLNEIKLTYCEMEIKEENGNIITCDYIQNNIEEFVIFLLKDTLLHDEGKILNF